MDINEIEHIIIQSLLGDEKLLVKTISKISPSFFQEKSSKFVFKCVKQFYQKYNKTPNKNELSIMVGKYNPRNDYDDADDFYEECVLYTNSLDDEIEHDFAYDVIEDYCRKQAIMAALQESIDIVMDDSNEGKSFSKIPEMLAESVSFAFNHDIGLDYYNDIDDRMEYYTNANTKFPFKLEFLNKITNGGVEADTLNMVTAPTGFGKSIFMADEALYQSHDKGLNVCYYTFEMSDKRISNRVDSNSLNINVNRLPDYTDTLREKFEKQRETAKGRLFIKEYAPQGANALTIANHIKLVEQQEGIKIDIVYIDYVNLMASAKASSNANTYETIKFVCEEMISNIAKAFHIPVVSATQLNRNGQRNTDVSVVDIAESQGLTNTVDFLVVFYDNDELKKEGRAIGKQLKNRYGGLDYYNTFMVGIERSKMRFFDVGEDESDNLIENKRILNTRRKNLLKRNSVILVVVHLQYNLGIDYSMSCPCVCVGGLYFFYITTVKKYEGITQLPNGMTVKGVLYNYKKEQQSGVARFSTISNLLMQELVNLEPAKAFFEGYSYGSKGNVFEIGENTGIFKKALYDKGWNIKIIPPKEVKKSFSGSGTASKVQMADAWEGSIGFSLHEQLGSTNPNSSPATDIIDSYAIYNTGMLK